MTFHSPNHVNQYMAIKAFTAEELKRSEERFYRLVGSSIGASLIFGLIYAFLHR